MRIARTLPELKSALKSRPRIAFVPTMGNLHAGHLSLVALARERAPCAVASIFVNRLQFAPHEDFAAYPRTLERDCELLAEAGCDLVFAPEEHTMYPVPQGFRVLPPEDLADTLEGQVRPGFFTGVCTVVAKLFSMVQPAAAVFGKKDYQQLRVIENMVRQLALPIDVLAGETVRSPLGLALSSRNGYLNGKELEEAASLHGTLTKVVTAVRAGRTDFNDLERNAIASLASRGWVPDYVAIRAQDTLHPPKAGDRLVVLGAARLGSTRLIDNLEV
jgi:pantoate--beta-alanine ligase